MNLKTAQQNYTSAPKSTSGPIRLPILYERKATRARKSQTYQGLFESKDVVTAKDNASAMG